MKLFFQYSKLNDDPITPTYFLNNTDSQNTTTGVSEENGCSLVFPIFYNSIVILFFLYL